MNRKKTIYEPDEVKAVFTFLKAEKNIIDITESGSISTIYTDSLVLLQIQYPVYLQTGQIVTINNINYQISNVNLTNKTFDIDFTTDSNIGKPQSSFYHMSSDTIPVKILDATKWNLAIDFKFGSRMEINEILDIEVSDPAKKLQRFPLIWLFINENRDHDNLEYSFKTGLKMSFVHLSKQEYRAEYRKENIFKPIIVPLVELFMEAIQSSHFSRVFAFGYNDLNYNEYFRYFYGSATDKNKMVLNAPTDAIEIDFDVTFANQYY
jgi:hypothetical protein